MPPLPTPNDVLVSWSNWFDADVFHNVVVVYDGFYKMDTIEMGFPSNCDIYLSIYLSV